MPDNVVEALREASINVSVKFLVPLITSKIALKYPK